MARAAALLFAALVASPVFAGEPAALDGHTLRGHGRLRVDVRSGWARSVPLQEQAEIVVRLGPSSDCFWPLRPDQLTVSLVSGYSFVQATGSWGHDPKGRTSLTLDTRSLEDELRDAYRAACEQVVSPAACDEAQGGLEARVVRSELVLKAAAERLRLRARLELALVDPATGEVAGAWALAFRSDAGLEAQPPVDTDCGDDDGGILISGPGPR
jgi:hypothetical protein